MVKSVWRNLSISLGHVSSNTVRVAAYLIICFMHFNLAAVAEATTTTPLPRTTSKIFLRIDHFSSSQNHRQSDLPTSQFGPSYTVVVFDDGTVQFRGIWNVKQNSGSHKLAALEMRTLRNILKSKTYLISNSQKVGLLAQSLPLIATVSYYPGIIDVHGSFNIYESKDYDKFRTEVEPFLRTMTYRCPVPNSFMKIEVNQQTVDFCSRVFEFGDQEFSIDWPAN